MDNSKFKLNIFLLLLSFALGTTYAGYWTVVTSDKNVSIDHTTNFTIGCRYNNSDPRSEPVPYDTIQSIYLLRQYNSSSFPDIVAGLDLKKEKRKTPWQSYSGPHDGEATGEIYLRDVRSEKHIKDSWLTYKWATATFKSLGIWHCRVIAGYHGKNYNLKSDDFTVLPSNSEFKRLRGKLYELLDELDEMYVQTSRLLKDHRFFDQRFWPDGPFALLQSNTTCPNDNNTANNAVTTTSTTTASNKTYSSFSSPYALENMIYKHGRMSRPDFRYCTMKNTTSGQYIIRWPPGRYCVHGAPDCPYGLESSKLVFKPNGHFANTPDGKLVLHFCCRDDYLERNSLIFLPTVTPFFLYRLGGRCQPVHDMQFHLESIQFDSDYWPQADKWEGKSHPDGTLKPVFLWLCYYIPNSVP